MGRLVVSAVLEDPDLALVAAIGHSTGLGADAGALAGRIACGVGVTPVAPDCFRDADVIVDFSLDGALAAALPAVRVPLVTGTTGLEPETQRRVDALGVAVLQAANFSTGVTLLSALVATAARALPDYDVEIVEAHHRNKVDAPSGTALLLARRAAGARGLDLDAVAVHGRSGKVGARPRAEIGIHAVRGGDVVGEHEVWLAGPGERLKLGHVASSRETFARGAVRAARWLVGKPPGRYRMEDVLGL